MMNNQEKNSMGFTKEKMDRRYPYEVRKLRKDEKKNKHYHWVKHNICLICGIIVDEAKVFDGAIQERKVIRHCRECNKVLSKDRYLRCLECQPELDNDDGNLIYFQTEEDEDGI